MGALEEKCNRIIELEYPFFSLPDFDLNNGISDFILDSEFYEKEIGKINGLELDLITKNSIPKKDYLRYEELNPVHYEKNSKELLKLLAEEAKEFRKPFSKKVKDIKELKQDVIAIHQVAYAHYVIAKQNSISNGYRFPKNCCGLSSRGVTTSLWLHGFLNAGSACAVSKGWNHGYVILPFVMEKPSFKGVIIIDPTSDQFNLIEGEHKKNLTLIKEGTSWQYYNNNPLQADMFPKSIFYMGLLNDPNNIDLVGRISQDTYSYFQDVEKFLKLAYANPIELEVSYK